MGEDQLALAPGLTFALLGITQGEGATFISLSRGERLAAILGVQASAIALNKIQSWKDYLENYELL